MQPMSKDPQLLLRCSTMSKGELIVVIQNLLKEMTTEKERNWTEEDIGKEIAVKFKHGTEMVDTIVSIPLQMPVIRRDEQGNEFHEILGDGQMIIGPSIEVGMIHARLSHSLPLVEMQRIQQMSLQKAVAELEDETEEE